RRPLAEARRRIRGNGRKAQRAGGKQGQHAVSTPRGLTRFTSKANATTCEWSDAAFHRRIIKESACPLPLSPISAVPPPTNAAPARLPQTAVARRSQCVVFISFT